MKQTLKKTTFFALSLIVAIGIVAGAVSYLQAPAVVDAGANHNFSGFAWSDMPTTSNEVSNPTAGTVGRGAGWISFNNIDIPGAGIDYGVNVDAAGNISGNAWSEHVGWISFNNSTGCPTNNGTNCQPRIENIGGSKQFKGWARAMAYTDQYAGGWDGWISLSSTNHTGSVVYGWTVNSANNVSGYIWGGDILGWISAYNLKINQIVPNLVLTANPSTISSANALVTDLTYNSPNTAVGAASPFSSCTFTTTPSSGAGTGTPVHNTTLSSASTLPVNANRTITGVRVYNPANHQTEYKLTCTPSAGGANVVATAIVTITAPQPTASLTGPSCVKTAGTAAQLVWATQNVASCSITPGIGTLQQLSGNQAVTVGATTTYNLSCSGTYGPANASHTITINPNCQETGTGTGPGGGGVPIFEEV